MIVSLSVEQISRVRELTGETKYSVNEVLRVLEAIYSANLEEDIKSALEHLEEVE